MVSEAVLCFAVHWTIITWDILHPKIPTLPLEESIGQLATVLSLYHRVYGLEPSLSRSMFEYNKQVIHLQLFYAAITIVLQGCVHKVLWKERNTTYSCIVYHILLHCIAYHIWLYCILYHIQLYCIVYQYCRLQLYCIIYLIQLYCIVLQMAKETFSTCHKLHLFRTARYPCFRFVNCFTTIGLSSVNHAQPMIGATWIHRYNTMHSSSNNNVQMWTSNLLPPP